jgi:hypothetical protein
MPNNILIHKDMEPDDIHAPYSFQFNNELERTTLTGTTSQDIGKIGIQIDNYSIWMLTSNTPTWKRLLLQGDSTIPMGSAGGDLTGIYPNPSVIGDSHNHTPGVSIPSYPSSLPPTGVAGGDLTGIYPNPQLELSGVVAGLYTNASLNIDAKGRITRASSNPLGESNTGQNLGPGKQLYAGKVGTSLTFRTLIEAPNSGISLSITSTDITINTPNLAKLNGAAFTGPILAPLITTKNLVVEEAISTPITTASYGSLTWIPNASNGSNQLLPLTTDVAIDGITGAKLGSSYKFFLRQPSSGTSEITYSTHYRFPQGMDRTLSTTSFALDVLEVFVLSSSFYYCTLYKNVN